MAAKYELKPASKGKFMFNLKAGNGEVILTSETYNTRDAALNGIESVKNNATGDGAFDVRTAKNGETYFVVLAKNKQIIGKSEMYKTPAGCKRGIESVKKNSGAAVSDLTVKAAAASA